MARAAVLTAGGLLLAVHAAGWIATVSLWQPPRLAVQSMALLALAAAGLAASRIRARRRRAAAAAGVLGAFFVLSLALPLPTQFNNNGFMGDGYDYATDRAKFDLMFPLPYAISFSSHLADALIWSVDRAFGAEGRSSEAAYAVVSRFGGVLFLGEVLAVLALGRWSPRTCRFAALALAAPLAVTFFGYYENGYLAASIAAFPLLALAVGRRAQGLTQLSGGLQGLHAALHGFGVLGIGGGVLALLAAGRARWSRLSAVVQFAAFAGCLYLGWIFLYAVGFKMSVTVDQAVNGFGFRQWDTAYFFDRRLVHPLTTWTAFTEIGAASLSAGIPALAVALLASPARRLTTMALAFALPALAFLVIWWPSPGVGQDTDLFVGAFSAVGAAAWLGARRPAVSWATLGALALCHLAMWTTIGSRAFERIWIDG